ncbi:ribose 5-phosphate isomerase B [candidate division WOR-3 bacterium]|jgi:RpiB/LacA/LacB family sugar-phosphate isomerase|nr:ribose 5-phosphate isomerase B [candidate division WOR-3 bacterium]
MIISIGSDHAGFKHKEEIKELLNKMGHKVLDMGTDNNDSCDYSVFAIKVAENVAMHLSDRGVLVCNTGIGMSIAANKVKGCYAALVRNNKDAFVSRHHNNSNIICFGAERNNPDEIKQMLEIWLNEKFDKGRHERRINLIKNYENNHFIGGSDE